MKTKEVPVVGIEGLTDLALPAVMWIPRAKAEMLKSGWLEWLERHERFKFDSPSGKFTAYKSRKGYWTAQRRVHGKLRHEYLGSSSDLIYETLDQAARKMNMGDSAYWREKYPDLRAEQKPKAESHNGGEYETVSAASLQTRQKISFTEDSASLSKAIAQALAEIEDLRAKRKQDLDFSYIRAVGLSSEIEKLEAKLQLPALEEIRDRVLLRQSPGKRRELKKVLDALITELALKDDTCAS